MSTTRTKSVGRNTTAGQLRDGDRIGGLGTVRGDIEHHTVGGIAVVRARISAGSVSRWMTFDDADRIVLTIPA